MWVAIITKTGEERVFAQKRKADIFMFHHPEYNWIEERSKNNKPIWNGEKRK